MNHFFKIFLFLSASVAFFSCSDEFVNEKSTISGVAASAIIISPEWEADDYEFKCEGIKTGEFTINSKPGWLILDSSAGEFTDSIATVHGTVETVSGYASPGVYVDQMVITTGGKQYAVPIYYITEGTPSVQLSHSFEIAYNNYNPLQISNTGDGILLWDVVSMPEWLKVDQGQFDPTSFMIAKGRIASLPLILDSKAALQNSLTGTLVLKTNDKSHPLVEIAVTANLGTPQLTFYNDKIDFGSTQTSKRLDINNYGSGILVWSIEGLPDWLSVSPASGMFTSYQSADVVLTCDRSKMQPGFYSATINLKTNSPNKTLIPISVIVRVPGINANLKPIEGNIFDAAFDKNTNTLYYVTGLPNKLVAYDVTAKTVLHEVFLSKAPTCLSIDENFKQALIGHGGLISKVDLSTFQVSKTYELNTTVYDVEWAKDDWFCYTTTNTSTYSLLWMNSSTGNTYLTPQSPMNYNLRTAVLKKVPNQPYIIACRRDVSPTGIFVFDLDTKALKSYSHTSIDNTWFFNQGEFIITGYSSIIRTSIVTGATGGDVNTPGSIGVLKAGDYTNAIWWADYSAANHSIWALLSYYTTSYYPPVKGLIYQFEDNDYTLVKTYTYDNMYQPNAQTAAYEVEARYVFANNAGAQLSVLRKGTNNTTWSLELIDVK